jgi:hypothetical protein
MTPKMMEIFQKRRQNPEYPCKYCTKVFAKACSLGGHMSKSHSDKKGDDEPMQQLGLLAPANNSSSMDLVEDGFLSKVMAANKLAM